MPYDDDGTIDCHLTGYFDNFAVKGTVRKRRGSPNILWGVEHRICVCNDRITGLPRIFPSIRLGGELL